jgi:hypothetical protein
VEVPLILILAGFTVIDAFGPDRVGVAAATVAVGVDVVGTGV